MYSIFLYLYGIIVSFKQSFAHIGRKQMHIGQDGEGDQGEKDIIDWKL